MFIDGFVHPIFRLLVATMLEVTVCLDESKVFVNHIPDFLNADTIEAGISQDLRYPARFGRRKQMKGVTKMSSSQFCLLYVVAVRLIDDDTVRHLHDASLDTLQLVTRPGKLNQQEEIYHRVDSRLALPYSDRLYKYLVESGCLTKDYGLTRLAGYTSQ